MSLRKIGFIAVLAAALAAPAAAQQGSLSQQQINELRAHALVASAGGGILVNQRIAGQEIPIALTPEEFGELIVQLVAHGKLTTDQIPGFVLTATEDSRQARAKLINDVNRQAQVQNQVEVARAIRMSKILIDLANEGANYPGAYDRLTQVAREEREAATRAEEAIRRTNSANAAGYELEAAKRRKEEEARRYVEEYDKRFGERMMRELAERESERARQMTQPGFAGPVNSVLTPGFAPPVVANPPPYRPPASNGPSILQQGALTNIDPRGTVISSVITMGPEIPYFGSSPASAPSYGAIATLTPTLPRPATGPVIAANANTDWMTGEFDTVGGGWMKLNRGSGTYKSSNGRIAAEKITGNVMEGTWTQDSSGQQCKDGGYHGKVRLTFTANSVSGLFGYCDETPAAVGGFSGTRKK